MIAASGGKPGPGWYFNPGAKEWCLISKEEHTEAAQLVTLGYVQTSAKYRSVTLFQGGDYRKELDNKELTYGVFASFREQREIDLQLQQHRAREARRNHAKRILYVLEKLPVEDREDFMLNVLCDGPCAEYVTGRRIGLSATQIDEAVR